MKIAPAYVVTVREADLESEIHAREYEMLWRPLKDHRVRFGKSPRLDKIRAPSSVTVLRVQYLRFLVETHGSYRVGTWNEPPDHVVTFDQWRGQRAFALIESNGSGGAANGNGSR